MSAALATSIFTTSIHVFGVRRTMSWVKRRERPGPPPNEPFVVRDVATAVRRTEWHSPIRGTCLSRSLALQWLLARRGIESVLRLGGRIADGQFEAHAWVEYDGVVVGSSSDVAVRFATFVAASSDSPLSPSPRPGMPPL